MKEKEIERAKERKVPSSMALSLSRDLKRENRNREREREREISQLRGLVPVVL